MIEVYIISFKYYCLPDIYIILYLYKFQKKTYNCNHFNIIVQKNSMRDNLGTFTHQWELAKTRNKPKKTIPWKQCFMTEEALKPSLNKNKKIKEEIHTRNIIQEADQVLNVNNVATHSRA